MLKLISKLALYVLRTCAVLAVALRSQSKERTGGWTRRDVTVTTWCRKETVIILYVNCRLSLPAALPQRVGPGYLSRYSDSLRA